MGDSLCDSCRTVFLTKWRHFSLLGNHDPNTRPGWRRNLSRLCHRSPCLVYEGRRSRLTDPGGCWMCKRQSNYSEEAAARRRHGHHMLSLTYRPGQGPAAVEEKPGWRSRLWDYLVEMRLYEEEDAFRMRFELSMPDSEVNQVDLSTRRTAASFKLFAEADSPLAPSIPLRPGLWDTSSEATYAFLRRCISECDAGHTCTRPPTGNVTRRPPRRLVQIVDDGGDGLRLKLVETRPLVGGFPRYCALSYCWGDPAQHAQTKTLRSNVRDHEAAIDLPGLPKTVSDAVACCRRLGLTHLWVDALCIVQDDDGDKLSEIAAMGDIYANAYLTIAPSSASGSDDGFLGPRENPFRSAPIPGPDGAMVDVKWVPGGAGLLNSSTMVQLKGQRPKAAKTYEPLHSRGWTFQEAMLSKRIVFYSIFQPYWVCRQAARAGGEPSPREYFAAMELRELFPSLSPSSGDRRGGGPGPDRDLGYRWPWVAEQYSSRVLSVLGDKALAIHAVKETHRDGDGAYAAGVWLRNVKVDLLWSAVRRHPRTPSELRRFGTAYRRGRITEMPSWSWLSFDGSVRFDVVWHAFHTGMIRHVDDIQSHVGVQRTPATDAFGRLTGHPLLLRGPVKKVVVAAARGRGRDRFCYESKVWDGASNSYTTAMSDRAALGYQIGQAVFDSHFEVPDDRPPGDGRDISEDFSAPPVLLDCVLVSTVGDRQGDPVAAGRPRGYSRETRGNETAYGLLLRDVPGSGGVRKVRVGLFRGHEGSSSYFDDGRGIEFALE